MQHGRRQEWPKSFNTTRRLSAMYRLAVPCSARFSTGVDRPTLPDDLAISVPLDIIGFKTVGYTVSGHMGLDLAEPDRSLSHLRHLAAKNIINFSHAKDEDQDKTLIGTSFTIGNTYASGLPMTACELNPQSKWPIACAFSGHLNSLTSRRL
jgi:hypothetical protein